MSTTAAAPVSRHSDDRDGVNDYDADDPTESGDVNSRISARRELIDQIDQNVIELIEQRKDLATQIQRLRVSNGGPRLSIDRESEIIRRYRAALGKQGAEMAHLMLNISRGSRYEVAKPPAGTA
jgi:chorismate mutase